MIPVVIDALCDRFEASLKRKEHVLIKEDCCLPSQWISETSFFTNSSALKLSSTSDAGKRFTWTN